MTKTKILTSLKDFYRKLAKTDLKPLNESERTKILDLYADVQNTVIFLETGQDLDFIPDWSC